MTRKHKQDLPEWDDGRTIASMNVEGTPWYRPEGDVPDQLSSTDSASKPKGTVMTKEESRYYTWGALKATLVVTGVMCAGIILFVLFCQFVWFR